MKNDEIEIEVVNDIPKVEYYFYVDDNINFNESKKIHITQEMIKYDLILEKNEDDIIILTINEKNENIMTKYQTLLNIQNFINLSPYFKFLYTINSIYCIDNFYSFIKSKLDKSIINNNKLLVNNNIINIINLQNSKIKITHLNNDNKDTELNKIFFIFDIVYINLKKETIKIELSKVDSINDKDLINIYQILLKNKFNYIQRMNYLEKKLPKIQQSFNKYDSLLKKCNSYFDRNMGLKMSFLDIGIDTDIFDTPEQYNFIVNTISNLFNKAENDIYLEQIYKASCNGDNIDSFHSKCDNIKYTLILIISDDRKKFGGFTCAEWDNSNKYKYDDKAFLFSLDSNEIYPILNKYKNKAINCRNDFYAPIFGEDLFIFDGFFSSRLNKTEEKYFDYSKSNMIKEKYKLSGKKNFTITEMEVYKINFFE